jgi:hypothetical protein
MDLLKMYRLYKRAYQFLLGINILFFAAGTVMVFEYLQTREISELQLAVLGGGALFCGILIPSVILLHMTWAVRAARRRAEETVAKYVGGWIQKYGSSHDGSRDPSFWMNLALMSTEIWGEHAKHPVAQTLAHFAPVLRNELEQKPVMRRRKKRLVQKKKAVKTARHSRGARAA